MNDTATINAGYKNRYSFLIDPHWGFMVESHVSIHSRVLYTFNSDVIYQNLTYIKQYLCLINT